jgi:hypothetical protein
VINKPDFPVTQMNGGLAEILEVDQVFPREPGDFFLAEVRGVNPQRLTVSIEDKSEANKNLRNPARKPDPACDQSSLEGYQKKDPQNVPQAFEK